MKPLLPWALTMVAMVGMGMSLTGNGDGQGGPRSRGSATLDRLYTLPWLIGTTPKGVAWSPDSQRLAFLWNDDGTNFYDVWIAARDGGPPVRVTSMPRPVVKAGPPDDVAALQAATRAEIDPGVGAVVWQPDGARLVFTFRGDLYLVEPGRAPVQLTTTPGVESRLAFAPRGEELAYVLDGDLWVSSLAGATSSASRKVTSVAAGGIGVESFRWAPDGRSLAFIETDRTRITERLIPDYLPDETAANRVRRAFPGEPAERRRLGVAPASGGETRWIDLGPDLEDNIFGYAWSPDGATLLVDKSDLYVKERRLLLVDVPSGTVTQLLREADAKNVSAEWWADWAPDGRGVFFVSDRDNDYHVYYVPREGGAPTRITSGDWAVFDVKLSARAKALFVVANLGRPEERQVFRVPLSGGAPVRLSWRPGTHAPVVAPDGLVAADGFSSDDTPPDLFLMRLDASTPGPDTERQVTRSPRSEFSEYTWVTPSYVTFLHHKDGVTLHGRLTLPPALDRTKKYPAILGSVYSNTVRNQWGGRTAHPTWGLDQFLAQRGYVLLNVDISGSSGHGKAFRQRIGLDYGGIDVEDLYSGVQYLKSLGFIDEKRIGIWGSSYGGLLTTMSLFTKPGVYAAGIAGAPATNVWHAMTGEMRVMLRPQDHAAEYAAASSHTKSSGLTGHLMIVHGMRDTTVLYRDSVALVQRLLLQGKDVDLVTLPDAPHGWDTEGLAQTRYAFGKMVQHFDRYLGPGGR